MDPTTVGFLVAILTNTVMVGKGLFDSSEIKADVKTVRRDVVALTERVAIVETKLGCLPCGDNIINECSNVE